MFFVSVLSFDSDQGPQYNFFPFLCSFLLNLPYIDQIKYILLCIAYSSQLFVSESTLRISNVWNGSFNIHDTSSKVFLFFVLSQLAITSSTLTIETLEQGVKYVQS